MQKDRFSKPFLQQTLYTAVSRLLAVGCAAAASRKKRAKNKASFQFKTFYRMTRRTRPRTVPLATMTIN